MRGWTKYFADGSYYVGTDEDIKAGRASWTKSRSDNMIGVSFLHDAFVLKIDGNGQYWQSDTYESLIGQNGGQLVRRRVMKKILPHEHLYYVDQRGKYLYISFMNNQDNHMEMNYINLEQSGHWLVAEMDLKTQTTNYYFTGDTHE